MEKLSNNVSYKTQKDDSSALTNMSPIDLLEILCKHVLLYERKKARHPFSLQHGYRWRQETDTAILHLLNAVEQSPKQINYHMGLKEPLPHSPPPNLIRIAWTRLDVSSEYVKRLPDLDANCLTYIFTPHMFSSFHFQPPSVSDLSQETTDSILLDDSTSFHPERGVTQGDIMVTVGFVGGHLRLSPCSL